VLSQVARSRHAREELDFVLMGQWICHFDQKPLMAIRHKHLQAGRIPHPSYLDPSWSLFVCRLHTFSQLTENLAN
jgi:hypothetical protein